MQSRVALNSPLFTDYGGLRLGDSLWMMGGVLELHDDSLVATREGIRCRVYVLPRASITRLSVEQLHWLLFSGGLRIEHKVDTYPSLFFYSRDIEALTVQLQKHGFPVSPSEA